MHIKKFTQKDRYGNQMSYEFEVPEKGLDPTKIMEKAMETMGEVPQMMSVSAAPPVGGEEFNMGDMVTHPGGPKGSDTVPAWLTPGEFVVNAEAMAVPELAQQVEDINNMGRQMKNMGGPIYQQTGGMVDEVPFLAGPRLNDPQYAEEGDWITDELLDRLAEVESGGRNDAVSPAGAVGKYQWLPGSAAKAGYGVEAFDPMDEKAAREATRQYIKNMQQHHGFTKDEALRAYNWGPKNVLDHRSGKRKDMPDEAFQYPRKILDTLPGGPAPAPRPARTNEELWSAAAGDAPNVGGIIQTLSGLFKADGGEIPYLFDGGQLLQSIAQDPEASEAVAPWLREVAADPGSYINPVDTTPPPPAEESIDAFGGEGEDVVEGPPSDEELRAMRDRMMANASGFNIPNYGGTTAYPDREDTGVAGVVDTMEDRKALAEEEAATAVENVENAMVGGDVSDVVAASKQAKEAEDQVALADRDIERRDAHFAVQEAEKQAKELATERDSMNRKANALEAAGLAEEAAKVREEAQALGAEADKASAEAEAARGNEQAIWAKEESEGSVLATKPAGQNPSSNSDTNIDPNTKEGNEEINKIMQNADSEQRKQVQAEAQGILKDLGLDSLFDKKELARMAVMYGASRLLGYDHGGSLQWAGQQYLQRVDAKDAAFTQLAISGKYNKDSLAKYKKSGNILDLDANATPLKRLGNFKTFYKNGKEYRAEEFEGPGGNKIWRSESGVIDASYSDDASSVPGTPEYDKRINDFKSSTTDQLKEMQSRFDKFGSGDEIGYKTDILPANEGGDIAKWAVKNGVRPEELSDLVESAYMNAINDKRQDNTRVRSLTPYLNQLVIRKQVGNPDIFVAKGFDPESGGPTQYVNAEKMANLNQQVAYIMRANGIQSDKASDLSNQFYDAAVTDWNQLTTPEQEQFIRSATDDESGFYKYVQSRLAQVNAGG